MTYQVKVDVDRVERVAVRRNAGGGDCDNRVPEVSVRVTAVGVVAALEKAIAQLGVELDFRKLEAAADAEKEKAEKAARPKRRVFEEDEIEELG